MRLDRTASLRCQILDKRPYPSRREQDHLGTNAPHLRSGREPFQRSELWV